MGIMLTTASWPLRARWSDSGLKSVLMTLTPSGKVADEDSRLRAVMLRPDLTSSGRMAEPAFPLA
jgi:hypothetical protein